MSSAALTQAGSLPLAGTTQWYGAMARANACRVRHGAARWWPPQGNVQCRSSRRHRMQLAVFAVKLRGEGSGIFGAGLNTWPTSMPRRSAMALPFGIRVAADGG